jgi:uncharacterized membrane protein (DUF106 family)
MVSHFVSSGGFFGTCGLKISDSTSKALEAHFSFTIRNKFGLYCKIHAVMKIIVVLISLLFGILYFFVPL